MVSEREQIKSSDIMYKDDLVCILKPEIKKGIIILTNYTQPPGERLSISGLKTGKKLHEEGVQFGRTIIHPYIFFSAPYYSREIDYTTLETEIYSSFGKNQLIPNRIFIRVDPDQTFVFSSEIRAKIPTPFFCILDGRLLTSNELSSTHMKFIMKRTDDRFEELNNRYYNNEINKSKKTLSNYLTIIKYNENILNPVYNLYTSRAKPFESYIEYPYSIEDSNDLALESSIEYPYNIYPIERNSEILVSIPHLTREYFVLCT